MAERRKSELRKANEVYFKDDYLKEIKAKIQNHLDLINQYEYGNYKAGEEKGNYKELIKIDKLIEEKQNDCDDDCDAFKNEINKIVLWKLHRYVVFEDNCEAQKTLKKIASMQNADLESEINNIAAKTKDYKKQFLYKSLTDLLEKSYGINLPMLSTILRFLNPDVFPIIDARAYRSSWVLYYSDGRDFEYKEYEHEKRKDCKKTKNRNAINEEQARKKPINISKTNAIVEYCRYITRLKYFSGLDSYGLENYSMADLDILFYKIDEDSNTKIDGSLIHVL